MQLGYVGLGKMGLNMVERLRKFGHEVVAYNHSEEGLKAAEELGAIRAASLADLASRLSLPPDAVAGAGRVIWLMVPHAAVDDVLKELRHVAAHGDIIIDGGNSFYKDTLRRANELEKHGIRYMDVAVSGGPAGAKSGACLMIGGPDDLYAKFEPLFKDLAAPGAYGHMGPVGAGHFVKMVHNGIEYGMMQAIAEGFEIMKKAPFPIDLKKVADVYNHRSVVESRLVGWLNEGYEKYGVELTDISSAVAHTGEGEWTVKTAKELSVDVPIIEGAYQFRVASKKNPRYAGKVLSMLRNMFGGHSAR